MEDDEPHTMWAYKLTPEADYELFWCDHHQGFHQRWVVVMKGEWVELDLDE